MKESTNTFLFQGDSVTDAGRDRQCPQSLGNGYVSIIAGEFLKMGQKHKIPDFRRFSQNLVLSAVNQHTIFEEIVNFCFT